MKLWLDLGNTRLKYWLLDDDGQVLEHDAKLHLHAPAELLMGLSDKFIRLGPRFVGISSVLGKEINQKIWQTLHVIGVDFEFAKVQKHHHLLTSDYHEEQLGVDRWLQMLGAVNSQKNQIIVGCGTAITVDILQKGHHLGGYIFPNAYLQREALYAGTQQIDVHSGKFDSILLADNTKDAVNHGILLAIVGGIGEIVKRYPDHDFVMTGGDGANIAQFLDKKPTIEKNLLLMGLQNYFNTH